MEDAAFAVDHRLFAGQRSGEVVLLHFKDKPLLHVADLGAKRALFNFLDRVACCGDTKVLLIKEPPAKMARAEFAAFCKEMFTPGISQMAFERMNNAVGQLILKLAGLCKLVVHADRGEVAWLSMNISLARDCRIVADDTVFYNPNINMDIAPKGGSVFFLSKMVGTATAFKILFSGEDLVAAHACQLGLVDKVVRPAELDRAALEMARYWARVSSGYAAGVKKLLHYDIGELAGFLEFESELLRRQIRAGRLEGFVPARLSG